MKRKLAALAILGFSVFAFAQFGGRGPQAGGRGRSGGEVPGAGGGQTGGHCLVPGYRGTGEEDLPTPRNINRSGFVYARIRYHTQSWWRAETREVPWHHDYPDGDTMFPDNRGAMGLRAFRLATT